MVHVSCCSCPVAHIESGVLPVLDFARADEAVQAAYPPRCNKNDHLRTKSRVDIAKSLRSHRQQPFNNLQDPQGSQYIKNTYIRA